MFLDLIGVGARWIGSRQRIIAGTQHGISRFGSCRNVTATSRRPGRSCHKVDDPFPRLTQ